MAFCLSKRATMQKEDIQDIQSFNELIFNQILAKLNSTNPNDPALVSACSQLLIVFQNLMDIYFNNRKWPKVFDLIDQIEQCFRGNSNKALTQDEFFRVIGDFFYKINQNLYAIDFYKRGIKASNESNLLIIESYENLVNSIVERWHYRMLNDKTRNNAYKEAIRRKISTLNANQVKTLRILDIGSGTGLLSVICLAEAYKIFGNLEKIKVYPCEQNDLFFKILCEFMVSLKLNGYFKALSKHSDSISVQGDLENKPVDLIVTEIFDDGLLGEDCLNTFYNALVVNKLLGDEVKLKTSKIVPQSAKVFICAIECEHIRRSTKFTKGFGFKKVTATCLDNSFKFENYGHAAEFNYEPYTTENLKTIEFKSLIEPVELSEFELRFDIVELLEKYCKFNETTSLAKKFKAIATGRLDAYITWFDLYLDEDTIVTNSPFVSQNVSSKNYNYSTCWHQSIYAVPCDLDLKLGEELAANVTLRKDCILVKPLIERILDKDEDETSLELNRYEIALLNNRVYQDFYSSWFRNELAKIINKSMSAKAIKIGYLTNTFSSLLLELIFEHKSTLKKDYGIELMIEIFLSNQEDDGFELNLNKFNGLVRVNDLNEVLSDKKNLNAVEFDLDYLVCEPIDFKYGVLRKNFLSDLLFIKDFNVKKDLEIFPSKIGLSGLFIQSNGLLNETELVKNENLAIEQFEPVNLKEILSEFKVKHIYSILNNSLSDIKEITECKRILEIDLGKLNEKSILDENEISFQVNENESFNAFLFSYEIFDEKNRNSYKPLEFLKNSNNLFNSYACIALDHEQEVQEKSLKARYLHKNSIFYIKLK